MEADEQHWQVMEKASFAFLHGKRMCIGRHLAWIKMKKVVATLILSFKVSKSWWCKTLRTKLSLIASHLADKSGTTTGELVEVRLGQNGGFESSPRA